MSKAEILAALPCLPSQEREQVLQRLCELREEDLLRGARPTEREKRLLDDVLKQFERDSDVGAPWREVLRRVCQPRLGRSLALP